MSAFPTYRSTNAFRIAAKCLFFASNVGLSWSTNIFDTTTDYLSCICNVEIAFWFAKHLPVARSPQRTLQQCVAVHQMPARVNMLQWLVFLIHHKISEDIMSRIILWQPTHTSPAGFSIQFYQIPKSPRVQNLRPRPKIQVAGLPSSFCLKWVEGTKISKCMLWMWPWWDHQKPSRKTSRWSYDLCRDIREYRDRLTADSYNEADLLKTFISIYDENVRWDILGSMFK